jgi:VanZ family protein
MLTGRPVGEQDFPNELLQQHDPIGRLLPSMLLAEPVHFPQHTMVNRSSIFWFAVGYLLLIVYGSLLPFHLTDLSFSAALANLRYIPLLELGVESRADLVANLLLYIPFGLLLCGSIAGANPGPALLATGALMSLLIAATVAVGVEFTQQFFAPRTVSLNDLFAELAGSIIGIVLWPVAGIRLVHLIQSIFRGGANARNAALIAYALGFAVLSLFPYDFLLSYDEWRAKLSSENVGWLFVPHCGGRCLLRLIPEALLVAPLAMLFFRSARRSHLLLLAAVTGAALGMLIEGLQLTIASGTSQGASIASRALGMMLGVTLMRLSPDMDWRGVRYYARPMLVMGVVPYLIALAWANGWFSGPWSSFSDARLELKDTRFLPFYYHYFTTETKALTSLLFQIALYLPVGAGIWLWRWAAPGGPGGSGETSEAHYGWAAFAAGMLASIIEAGKLFIAAQHPDPTNILIAAAAGVLASWLLYLLFDVGQARSETAARSAHAPLRSPDPHISAAPRVTPAQAMPPASPVSPIQPSASVPVSRARYSVFTGITGAAALCLSIAAAFSTPLNASWILPALIVYCGLLWWQPGLWLICVLALLPLLDLTPWSGRLFWTEYDTVLLATLGVVYLRLRSSLPSQRALRRPAWLLLSLFALSAAISLGIGLFPLGPFDDNAFASYISRYNALRVAKGVLFAMALIPLLGLEWTTPARAARRLAMGMTLGLTGTVLYILWERATFPGLLNFESDYRITGPFPGMHVGGAYIEAFLTAALPFVALLAWQQQRLWTTVFAIGLYGLGAYSVMVTFSRGGQAAFALSTFIVLIGFARLSLHERARRFYKAGAVIAVAGMAMMIIWPVFSGKYSQSRWAGAEQDFGARTAHWADALNIVKSNNASLFGLGLGAFPSAYYWNPGAASRTATYGFVIEQGNSVLRLGSGDSLFFEQIVPAAPEQRYILSIDLRASASNAGLAVSLCEKAILYSYTCAAAPLQINAPAGEWRRYEAQMETRGFGPPGSRLERPVKLSLFNTVPGSVVDVDNVILRDMHGNNLVRNSNFSSGMHRWFFSTDSYLPWHVENLYLNVYFEQGWLGLILFLALIGYAITRWLPRAWRQDALSLALLGSLTAFLAVGTLNSWADEPRLSFLFYLLLIAGLAADAPSTPPKSTAA